MKELPNKLSELLFLAVSDCEAVEKQSKYAFGMGTFFSVREEICTVCMAGAILVNTYKLELPKKEDGSYYELLDLLGGDEAISEIRKFVAIDQMRIGKFKSAYYELNYEKCKDNAQYSILEMVGALIRFNYTDQLGRADWDTYKKVAKILSEAGL